MKTATTISFAMAVFTCLWLMLACTPSVCAAAKPRAVRDLFSKAEIERMTSGQFMAAYGKRGDDQSEAGYDHAALYYAEVKADLHDRQAAKESAALRDKVRWIRAQMLATEGTAFDDNWTMEAGTMYLHLFNRMCMEREDAIGETLPLLQTHEESKASAKILLRRLAALDGRIRGKSRPYHKLARELAGLPALAVGIILKQEQSVVNLIIDFRREVLGGG